MIAPAPTDNSGLDGYQLKLPMFEGPFDVLIRLVEREQLEISELSLISVLDQFLAYMNALNCPPPSVIAEFVAVAGRLSLLKSRALLPKPPKPIEDADEPDLVRQIEEYRAIKDVAHLLAHRQQSGVVAFGRGEGVQWPEAVPVSFSPQAPTVLATAVQRWRTRIPPRPALAPMRRVVSLREMIARLLASIAPGRSATFNVACEDCATRQDVAVAFLALLVLLRRQAINASQTELFGPIVLTRAGAAPTTQVAPRALFTHDVVRP